MSSLSSWPSKARAWTAMYENRVSISPKESPAKTPDGCCRDRMTELRRGAVSLQMGWIQNSESTTLTFHYSGNINSVHGILNSQDLNGTQSSQNMCVMSGMCAECTYTSSNQRSPTEMWIEQTCLVVPTTHDKLDHLLSVQRIFMLHNTQRSQSPVDGVHSQMGRHVVDEIIFILRVAV